MKQNAEPYELVYTVKQEDDLYSPLKEGNVDRLDEEMKATLLAYWGKAGCVFISLAFLLGDSENAFLETMLEIMGSVAIWELAYALLITYPSTHLRYRKFQQFSQHCRIVVSTPA